MYTSLLSLILLICVACVTVDFGYFCEGVLPKIITSYRENVSILNLFYFL